MEDTNIYKITLNCLVEDSLKEEIEKDVNCEFDSDNKASIEMFSRRKIAKYFEQHLESQDKWQTIEIMVYWDGKSEDAYEITTGMSIPLLIMNEHHECLPLNLVKKHREKGKKWNYYNYSRISRYGYFGKINYPIDRKKTEESELDSSKKILNQLKSYIHDNGLKTNDGMLSFQSQLNSITKDSQIYVRKILNDMISTFEEKTKNSDNDTFKKSPLVMTRLGVSVAGC